MLYKTFLSFINIQCNTIIIIVLVKFETNGENIRKSYMIFIANIHFTEIVKVQGRLNSQLIIILISLNVIAVCNYMINYTYVLYLQ